MTGSAGKLCDNTDNGTVLIMSMRSNVSLLFRTDPWNSEGCHCLVALSLEKKDDF